MSHTATMLTNEPALRATDIADPAAFIAQVAELHPLIAGTILLVLIRDPSTTQEIIEIAKLPVDPRDIADSDAAAILLREAVSAMPTLDAWLLREKIVTIVVRPGLTVLGRTEALWTMAWWYGDHPLSSYTNWQFLVTEHGWLDEETGWAGHEPRMIEPCSTGKEQGDPRATQAEDCPS